MQVQCLNTKLPFKFQINTLCPNRNKYNKIQPGWVEVGSLILVVDSISQEIIIQEACLLWSSLNSLQTAIIWRPLCTNRTIHVQTPRSVTVIICILCRYNMYIMEMSVLEFLYDKYHNVDRVLNHFRSDYVENRNLFT